MLIKNANFKFPIKLRKKLNPFFVLFFLSSLLVLFSVKIPPSLFWPIVFLCPLIPIVVIINLILLPYYLYKKSINAVSIIICLLLSLSYIPKTYSFNENLESDSSSEKLKILSFNISFFNVPTVFSNQYRNTEYNPDFIIENIRSSDADIQCFQEFFDDKNSDIYNTIQKISEDKEWNYYFLNNPKHDNGVRRGLITFSKYPIINRGEIFLHENRYNGASYTDIVFDNDTIRVINVHLYSMKLHEIKGSFFDRNKKILRRYKNGALTREFQIKTIINFIENSPYKIIVCGDFNETPFSYAYNSLNGVLDNTFEKSGKGFGFTLNDKRLFFLRLDNMFHSQGIISNTFNVNNEVFFSHHFPIEGVYQIEN